MIYLFAFLLSLIIVVCASPLLSRLSVRLDFMDKPTERKNHPAPIPLAGGIAMFLSFCVGFLCFLGIADPKHIGILSGALLILVIGIVDDYYKTQGKEFKALPRMIVQLLAAVIIFAVDIRFTGFTNPLTEKYVLLPIWLQFILTITWIFGVTTVINFTDGMDGLAGGLTAISGGTLFVAAVIKGQPDSAIMAALLVGGVLGFLRFNRHPAKIYMGDSGATFLGYILSVIALFGAFKQATVISVFVPVLALGVPIFDNVFVVVKRLLNKKPVYLADKSQIHYRLLKKGLKPTQVVAFLFLISVCLNLTSIIILLLNY